VRVLVFRHSPSDGLGLIGDVLDAHSISYDYADLYSPPTRPATPVNEADALILMGGAMSANDALPFITIEIEYIRDAVRRGKPVLGVCLGAQLIAKALGARVYANPVKEIGWAPVTFADAALSDPLFTGLAEAEVIFHWHGETFDLPAGAELLASSGGLPASGLTGQRSHLWLTISSRSHAGYDRRVVPRRGSLRWPA